MKRKINSRNRKNIFIKTIFPNLIFLVILSLIVFFTTGCPTGTNNQTLEYNFTGKIIDSVTGNPISGITVYLNNTTTTTDNDGNFTINLGENESVTSSVAVYETAASHNYQAKELGILTVNGSKSSKVSSKDINSNTIYLDPLYSSRDNYQTKNISGRIFLDDGKTQISDDSDITIVVRNSKGGIYSDTISYSQEIGYSFDSYTYGPDCFIEYFINDSTNGIFNYYENDVDFSSDITNHNIIQPDNNVTTVTVTGGDDGDRYFCVFETPNGYVPMLDPNDQDNPFVYGTVNTVNIYNPENYKVFWQRQKYTFWKTNTQTEAVYLVYLSTGDLKDLSSSMTLPGITTSNPDSGDFNVSYNSDTRTLSENSGLNGFSGRMFIPTTDSDPEDEVATILCQGNSVILPEALSSYFKANNPYTMKISGILGNINSFYLISSSYRFPPLNPSIDTVAYTIEYDEQDNFNF